MTSDASPSAADVRIGVRGVTRRFGSLLANEDVHFSAASGCIHAIIGGNGAGKSTLMRILQGMDQPDEGTVVVNGEPVRLSGPADAFRRGIGMVHQEFMLVPGLTLLENLVLGREPTRLGIIDRAAALAAARDLEAQAGVRLDWDLPVDDAPVHVRQIVEILRLIYRGADVLILDEPTAVLAPAQVRELIVLLRRLRSEGRTILFISHKLDEVMDVSDAVTVMRAGKVVACLGTADTSKAELAELMVGEPVASPTTRAGRPGEAMLAIRRLKVVDDRGIVRLDGIDLDVRAGEIVAVAGISGNGQDELVNAVTGLCRLTAGTIHLAGREIAGLPLSARRAAGLAYLSPDRAAEGLCLDASILENAIAGHHRRPVLARGGILRLATITNHAERLLDRFSVKRGASGHPIRSLSGGNQQKVAIARELDGQPRLLVACQPTRGVDIAGIAYIHQCLLDFRDAGGAVLLVSEELDEVLALADRIAVVYRGRLAGLVDRADGNVEQIGLLMLGEAA